MKWSSFQQGHFFFARGRAYQASGGAPQTPRTTAAKTCGVPRHPDARGGAWPAWPGLPADIPRRAGVRRSLDGAVCGLNGICDLRRDALRRVRLRLRRVRLRLRGGPSVARWRPFSRRFSRPRRSGAFHSLRRKPMEPFPVVTALWIAAETVTAPARGSRGDGDQRRWGPPAGVRRCAAAGVGLAGASGATRAVASGVFARGDGGWGGGSVGSAKNGCEKAMGGDATQRLPPPWPAQSRAQTAGSTSSGTTCRGGTTTAPDRAWWTARQAPLAQAAGTSGGGIRCQESRPVSCAR